MNLAVIDCGTNTFNLVVFDYTNPEKLLKKWSSRIPVKLGENALPDKSIHPIAFRRGLEAMQDFKRQLNQFDNLTILAFGTSAIRDAKNGEELTEEVFKSTQIKIEVIHGDREADLIFKGVKAAIQLEGETALIVDIGGGSTEFIIAQNNIIVWKQSFNIGAARMLQTFAPSNPVTKEEINAMHDFLNTQLEPLRKAIEHYPITKLVGSSGAFESVIELANDQLQLQAFSADIHQYEIKTEDYYKISNDMIASTSEQRLQMRGLVPMRVDMIVIFFIKMNLILKWIPLPSIFVSTFCLKEGAAIEFLENKSQ